eukprot:11380547-Heterocapsa_arctica.AAC.1
MARLLAAKPHGNSPLLIFVYDSVDLWVLRVAVSLVSPGIAHGEPEARVRRSVCNLHPCRGVLWLRLESTEAFPRPASCHSFNELVEFGGGEKRAAVGATVIPDD